MTAKKAVKSDSAGRKVDDDNVPLGGEKDTPDPQVQAVFDKAHEVGHFGVAVDVTPNENYTVAGVTSGAPTPETDKDAAKAASEALRSLADERTI